MDKYQGKKIAVLGYQVEGRSLVDFFIKEKDTDVTVIDEKEVDLWPAHDEAGVKLIVSPFGEVNLNRFDFIFRSPGINPSKLDADPQKISSLINLFFEYKKGKVIAVTGTKGKSTTILLLNQILTNAGIKTRIAGNIGTSPLEFVKDLTDDEFVLLELSSFQLMDFKYAPEYALVLPLFPDHLDYHRDEAEYFAAKANIFSHSSEVRVVCYEADQKKLGLDSNITNLATYSLNDDGTCSLVGDQLSCNGLLIAEGLNAFCQEQQVPVIDLVAASTMAFEIGLEVDLTKMDNFKKLPMRVELIGEAAGVKFYNDSASTNPISTAAAIGIMNKPFVLVIGGASKNLPLEPLYDAIGKSANIKRIYLIGQDDQGITKSLKTLGKTVLEKPTLKAMFDDLDISESEALLYSPAFASFDQYKNYLERGEDFNKLFISYAKIHQSKP